MLFLVNQFYFSIFYLPPYQESGNRKAGSEQTNQENYDFAGQTTNGAHMNVVVHSEQFVGNSSIFHASVNMVNIQFFQRILIEIPIIRFPVSSGIGIRGNLRFFVFRRMHLDAFRLRIFALHHHPNAVDGRRNCHLFACFC